MAEDDVPVSEDKIPDTAWQEGLTIDSQGGWVSRTSSVGTNWLERYNSSHLCQLFSAAYVTDIFENNQPHIMAEAAYIFDKLAVQFNQREYFNFNRDYIFEVIVPEIARKIQTELLPNFGIGAKAVIEANIPSSAILRATARFYGVESEEYAQFNQNLAELVKESADLIANHALAKIKDSSKAFVF